MIWTVTYRNETGNKDYISIEAESRTQLFSILQDRNIRPIRIDQGAIKSLTKNNKRSKAIQKIFLSITIAIVVGFAGFVTIKNLFQSQNTQKAILKQKSNKKTEIPQIVPSDIPTNIVEETTNVVAVKKIDDDKYRDERGILRYKKTGTRAFDPDRPRRKVNLNMGADGKPLYKPSPFKSRAENELYRLIKIAPGDTLVGSRVYDEHFEAEYMKSLKTPILISPDDDEETVAAKNAMIQVKAEINERIRNGEKLVDILTEAKSELKRLAEIKRMAKVEIITVAKEDSMTDDELNKYIQGVNNLLSEKGIAPIEGNMILRMNLIMKNKKGNQQ